MTISAGFAQTDISPQGFPIRTYLSSATEVLDPLCARAAAFRHGAVTLALVAFDVVIVEWEYVARLRRAFAEATGLPESNLLVCATHNHACPAVVDRPDNPKEDAYIDFMLRKGLEAVTRAIAALEPAEMALGSAVETRVSFNRRFIMKDGTAITQPGSMNGILCNEGVIDPGLEVAAFRRPSGETIGVLVNFACHAVHLMGKLSAGFPGVLCETLRSRLGHGAGCVFLNGACANIIHADFTDREKSKALTKEWVGGALADDVLRLLPEMKPEPVSSLAASEETIHIRYRDLSDLERHVDDPAWFVNVLGLLIKLRWYHYSLEKLKSLHAAGDGQDALVQCLRIGRLCVAAIPAEYFTEFGLRIKEQSPLPVMVSSLANGWLGYIPTPQALARRGGHETTICISSKMEPAAGDLLAGAALRRLRALAEEA